MAYVPNSGSVVAFEGGPWTTSVVGTVFVAGSVATVGTAVANQSVSGTVGASVIGLTPVSVSNFPTTQNVSGSVVATQGTNPWTVVSSIAGGVFPISGSVAAVVTNNVTVVSSISGGIFPISGSVAATITGTPNVNTAGSVVAFQGTSPWVVNFQNSSILAVPTGSVITVGQGSIATVIIGGSILTSSTANQSVSGTVGASVIGLTPVAVTNTPSISGSVNVTTIANNVPLRIDLVDETGFVEGSSRIGMIGGVFNNGMAAVAASAVGAFRITAQRGLHVVPVDINGSIQGTTSFPFAVSVVGLTPVTVSNTNTNVSGSVVAFQGGAPWANTNVGSVITTNIGSVIAVAQGSVAVAIISGSIAATFTPPANQSVSGTVNTIPTGTIITSLVSTVPSSVIFGASIFGLPPVNVTNTNLNVGGSVVAFQGGAPWANTNVGSIITASQGSVAVVIISGSVAVATGNSSVMLLNGANAIGSVTTLQGTNPWVVVGSVYGNVSGSIAGTYTSSTIATTVTGLAMMFKPNVSSSIMTEISPTWPLPITGAVAASISGTVATTLSGNPSISGTVNTIPTGTIVTSLVSTIPSSVIVGASIFGQLPAGTAMLGSVAALQAGTVPWLQTFSNSSIIALQVAGSILATSATVSMSNSSVMLLNGANVIGSVTALQGTNPWVTVGSVYGNISGSVASYPLGTIISSLVSTIPSSVIVGTSIFGQLPAGTAPLGSVATLQGTNPWIVNFQNSSIIALATGSVVTINQASIATVQIGQAGTVMTSVAGTYATGAASVISGLGQLNLGLRNDNLASIYGADAQYSPYTVGPVGEQMVANSPINDWVQSTGSCFTGVFQPITASTLGKYIYVTAIQIANASGNNAYIAFSGAGIGSTVGSLIGYTIAPANGGSNIYFPNGLKTGISNPMQASINAVASVYLSVQGFTSKV